MPLDDQGTSVAQLRWVCGDKLMDNFCEFSIKTEGVSTHLKHVSEGLLMSSYNFDMFLWIQHVFVGAKLSVLKLSQIPNLITLLVFCNNKQIISLVYPYKHQLSPNILFI